MQEYKDLKKKKDKDAILNKRVNINNPYAEAEEPEEEYVMRSMTKISIEPQERDNDRVLRPKNLKLNYEVSDNEENDDTQTKKKNKGKKGKMAKNKRKTADNNDNELAVSTNRFKLY